MARDRNICSRQRFNTVNWVLAKSLEGLERWALSLGFQEWCRDTRSWVTREAAASEAIELLEHMITAEIREWQSWNRALVTAVTSPSCWGLPWALEATAACASTPLTQDSRGWHDSLLQKKISHLCETLPANQAMLEDDHSHFSLGVSYSCISTAGPYWNPEH